MTQNVEIPVFTAVANGVSTAFPYAFTIEEAGDFRLTGLLAGVTTIYAYGTDYTLTGIGSSAGSVVFGVAPANGTVITGWRDSGLDRATDYIENGDLKARVVNLDFDRIIRKLQEIFFGPNGIPGAGLALSLLSNAGSTFVSFLQSGTGALLRTLQAKLRETVSITDFGADPSGVADCSSAIANAIAALPTYGGIVHVPGGTYKLTSPVTVNKRVKFVGATAPEVYTVGSCEFLKAATMTTAAFDITASGVVMEGITVRGELGNAGDGILIRAGRVTLRDCAALYMGQDGIRIGTDAGNENCNVWLLDNCKTKNNVRHGVLVSEGAGPLADANAGTCMHIDSQFNGADGLYLKGSQLCTLIGGAYQQNGANGLHFGPDASYHVVLGGDYEANSTAQIRIDTGAVNNALYVYTVFLAGISIGSTTANNRIECLDHNRLISGIKFPPTQIPSADPNTLDDYEENTFTPVVSGASTAGAASGYSVQSGRYTKYGREVKFTINVAWSGGHTGTGNTEITGLPFTAAAGLDEVVCIVQNGGPAPGAGSTRVALILAGATKVVLREQVQATGVLNNTNAITAAGLFDISGTYTAAN